MPSLAAVGMALHAATRPQAPRARRCKGTDTMRMTQTTCNRQRARGQPGRALGNRRAPVRTHACAVQVQTDSGWDDFDAAIDAQACQLTPAAARALRGAPVLVERCPLPWRSRGGGWHCDRCFLVLRHTRMHAGAGIARHASTHTHASRHTHTHTQACACAQRRVRRSSRQRRPGALRSRCMHAAGSTRST